LSNIIGIDHICISSNNISKDSKIFEKFGYKIDFYEKKVPIENEKKEFLKNNFKTHDFALLKLHNSVAIELIDHNKNNENINQIFSILFNSKNVESNDLKSQNVLLNKLKNIFNTNVLKLNINSTCNFFEYSEKENKINSIIIKINDIEKSKNFWCNLFGFVELKLPKNKTENYQILEFTSPIKNWNIKFILIEEKFKKKMKYLDDHGFTCISFLVTNIEDFLKKMNDFGLKTNSKPYETIVNGKKMRLIFLRGLENEIIELIEFRKNE
jgi:hypothetical protein